VFPDWHTFGSLNYTDGEEPLESVGEMTGAARPNYGGPNTPLPGNVLPASGPLQYGLLDVDCHVDRYAGICRVIPDVLYATCLDNPYDDTFIGAFGITPRQPPPDACRWVGFIDNGMSSILTEMRTDNLPDPTGFGNLEAMLPVSVTLPLTRPVSLPMFNPFYAEFLSPEGIRYAFSTSSVAVRGPLFDAVNVNTRPVWSFASVLLDEGYGTNDNAIKGHIRRTYRPITFYDRVPNDGSSTPGSIMVSFPEWDLFAISGTTNALQWFVQLTNATLPQLDLGTWSTMGAWYSSALTLLSRIPAPAGFAERPIFLLGDSMGGCCACIIAQLLRETYPAKPIKIYTQGMPRPGDDRLKWLLAGFDHARLVNTGDPVPTVPPDVLSALFLLPLVGPVPIYFWRQYRETEGCVLVDAFGGTSVETSAPTLQAALIEMVSAWVSSGPYANPLPHLHQEYRRRLEV